MNELIFIIHSILISCFALLALALGQYALVAFVCFQCLLCNLFVLKQITLFGLNATCTDAFTIGATLGLNLLQEYYGKKVAKQAIWINFFLLICYAILSQIHLLYTPNLFDTAHLHFNNILTCAPRIAFASLSVYLFVHFLDYYLYGFLKKRYGQKLLIVRNYTSLIICQFIDTVLFSFLGLYGIIQNITEIIVISYIIKLIAICIATPFIGFSKYIFNKKHK